MSVLDQLQPEDRTLVVALPYRVGLWISQIDGTGGDEALAMELQALSNIIHGFAHEVFGSEFVQHVMTETLRRKAEWPEWGHALDQIPGECAKALEIMQGHIDDKEMKTYCARLMDIAEAVALAFREYESMEKFSDKLGIYMAYWSARLKSKFTRAPLRSFDQFLSISSSERRALSRMARTLRVQGEF
jgi:hypothetical protein